MIPGNTPPYRGSVFQGDWSTQEGDSKQTTVTDIERVAALKEKHLFMQPSTVRQHVREIASKRPPIGYIQRCEVAMGAWSVYAPETDRDMLVTSGLATCVAICMTGKKEHSDQVVLGLAHVSVLDNTEDMFNELIMEMKQLDCTDLEVVIVGGQVNDSTDPEESRLEVVTKVLNTAIGLHDQGRIRLMAAHVGTSRPDPREFEEPVKHRFEDVLPLSVGVAVTTDGIFMWNEPDVLT